MRAVAAVATAAAAAAAAVALAGLAGCVDELPGEPPAESVAIATQEVIGGEDAPAGEWPDVAAVLYNGQQECTGVLIAPTIVLTAGHCNDSTLTSVLVGASSLARAGDGELIDVVQRFEYPRSQETEDLTVLVLARASQQAPRPLATGWAGADIRNGARAEIVGYGAIDRDAKQYIDELQQAKTTITDANCTKKVGCNAGVAPGGELGAGGMGVDTCPGDSGGPLYLPTSYGRFVAGITSRSYDDARYACSEGGIYARPGTVANWIEQVAGTAVERGPEPGVDAIHVIRGHGAEASIAANDPKTKGHRFKVAAQPARGVAKARSDGRVRVCADPEAELGEDAVTVTISDRGDDGRKLDVQIPVVVEDGDPPLEPCSVDDFEYGIGCCDGGRGARGSLPLALGVAALLRRSRRRPRRRHTGVAPAARQALLR
jgi:endonuclease G